MTQPAIECRGVWKIFGPREREALAAAKRVGLGKEELLERYGCALAVADVSFSVAQGEIFCIMGLSGCGKSTLIRHINRMIEPTAGRVLVRGEVLAGKDARELRSLRAEKLGMVFQNTALFPHRTARDNVSFGLEVRGVDRDTRRRVAGEKLALVQLSGWEDRYPTELSGGMQQRVGLARALAADPDILLMDEPFSALDPLIRRQLQDQFLELSAQVKKTTLFITHDLDEAMRLGDRIAIMKDGRFVQVGTPDEIVAAPADEYVEAFVSGASGLKTARGRGVRRPGALFAATAPPPDEDEMVRKFAKTRWAYYARAFERISRLGIRGLGFNRAAAALGPLWSAARGLWGAFAFGIAGETLGLCLLAKGRVLSGAGVLLGVKAIEGLAADWLYERRFARWRVDKSVPTGIDPVGAAAGGLIAAIVMPLAALHFSGHKIAKDLSEFPATKGLARGAADRIDGTVDWLSIRFEAGFDSITAAVRAVLNFLELVFVGTPWPVIALAFVVAAWRLSGVKTAAFTAAALAYLGFFGFWEMSMSTMSLVAASTLICFVFGTPLGVCYAKSPGARLVMKPTLDVMQTMPSFVYLIPAIAFFSIGKPPGVLATVIFAMPPLIRLTALGIEQVSPTVKEAAVAFGASPSQLLFKVELPLAAASILTGVNQTIMMSLSMVVVAALIGAGGLGYEVLFALQHVEAGRGILAGLAIVLCAMILDRMVQGGPKR